ncbi:MAG: GNAT family N-acetyltransferase [Flavobacteriales bacterium]|nr:GNAT family N-acetyltransferase [Flavobacteriales bacterium]
MRIKFIKASDTWSLRHRVLRPHQTIEDCDYPNDRNPDSFHLGVFIGEHLICIGSFFGEKNESLKGWKQYRLRGMATHPDFRGQGAGRKLIRFAIEHLQAQKADLLWCYARANAKRFYEALGFVVLGAPFDMEGIGEHFVMQRRV